VAPSTQYQPFLASAGVILTALGAGAEIVGLLRELYKDRRARDEKTRQRLRGHTKILNDDVYKRLLRIFVEPSGRFCRKRERMIPVSEKEFEKYDMQLRFDPFELDGNTKTHTNSTF
jgi:hypothetical protein